MAKPRSVPPAMCRWCGEAPKVAPQHGCAECLAARAPMPVQVASAERRKADALERQGGKPASRAPQATWPEGRRWCAGCQSFRRLIDCDGSRCLVCSKEARHEAHVQKTYGLEPGQYQVIAEQQGNRCAICRNQQKMRALAVHHDHKTGVVLGLLCKGCNHELLGGAHDSPHLLLRALALQLGGWPLVELVLELQNGRPRTITVMDQVVDHYLERMAADGMPGRVVDAA